MTTIFASDPHSCGQRWINKVEKMRYKYPYAEIVFGGDYVDGVGDIYPQETLNYIYTLQQNKPNIHVLIGNHDDLMWNFIACGDTAWLKVGGKNTYKSLFKHLDQYNIMRKKLYEYLMPDKKINLFQWLQSLDHYYQNKDGFFVHAYVNINYKSISKAKKHTRYYDLIWSREIATWQNGIPVKWNANLTGTPLIVGHTPTMYFKNTQIKNGYIQKFGETSCPIIRSEIMGCEPIYACDGGAKSENKTLSGNVCVFDNGSLIDYC